MNIEIFESSAPELDFSGKIVLIIENYQEMRSFLRDLLLECGVAVENIHMTATGGEAIAILKKKRFDIVLCDLSPVHGKNGQQVLEEAKFRSLIAPSCLWILITADKTTEAVTEAAQYKPDAYLLKPINGEDLRLRLVNIMARKEALQEIYHAMEQADYSRALDLCDQSLVSAKGNTADLLRTKCDLLLAAGDYDRAREFLEDILAERDLPWAKSALARILIEDNNPEASITLLKEILIEHPTFLEAHDLLIQILQKLGDIEGTSEALENAVKISPNSLIWQKNLGDVAFQLNDLERAEHAYHKSIALGENSILKTVDSYLGLAKVYSADKKTDKALKILKLADKSFPAQEVQLKILAVEGMVYQQNGKTRETQKIVNKINSLLEKEDIYPGSEEILDLARLLIATGNREKAVKLLQNGINNNPENSFFLQGAAEILHQAEMGEESSRLTRLRREALSIMNLGVLLVSKGQYAEALIAMRDARAAMPTNIRVLLNLAHVLITVMQKNGSVPELIREAHDCLLTAHRISPGESRHMRLLAALNALAVRK